MAHEITSTDGLFTVRQPAWHGLGTVLPDYPKREEVEKLVHPWRIEQEPLYRRVVTVSDDFNLHESYEKIEGWAGNVRTDTHSVLGVVTDTYEPVQNSEMYDIAEAIEGESDGYVKYETGGSLKGGAKVWLLLRLRDPLVLGGDPTTATVPYYALQNAHDGSGSFRGQATMTRIVCANTAHLADLDSRARGTEYTFRHTRNVRDRIEDAKIALAGWRSGIQQFKLQCDFLTGLPITESQREQFIQMFMPLPAYGAVSERVMENALKAHNDFRGIITGETCEAIGNTAYGLVQASVEYLNWGRRAHSAESRFKRTFLDSNSMVTHAVTLAMEVAK